MDIKSTIKSITGKEPIYLEDEYVDIWKEWYIGDVKHFHHYKMYNGKKFVQCKRRTLNMPKKICEDWANLLLNEKTDISIEGEENQKNINNLLNELEFWQKGNEGVEKSFALGNGAFVESVTDDGDVKIQFVNRTKIYPLTIEDDKITECAFVNIGSKTVTIQVHYKDDETGYYIIRTLFGEKHENDLIIHIGDIEKDIFFNTLSTQPWFQIIKPNIANNLNMNSPMGISVYANALDNIEGVDLAYDGFCNELFLGKARIFVDKQVTTYTADGETVVFDNNDIAFYVYGDGNSDNTKPLEFYNPTLRTDAFMQGINNALNLLSSKVGFGENHYRFDKGGITTATQVISENSEMFRTLKKHEILLNDVIINVVKTLMYICNNFGNGKYKFNEDVNIEVKFDDSIIEDKESQKLNDRQDVNLGVMSKAEYRAKWYNEDLDTARNTIEAIKQEQPDITNFFSGE